MAFLDFISKRLRTYDLEVAAKHLREADGIAANGSTWLKIDPRRDTADEAQRISNAAEKLVISVCGAQNYAWYSERINEVMFYGPVLDDKSLTKLRDYLANNLGREILGRGEFNR